MDSSSPSTLAGDSSSPSTLACDSSDCSDARNGEGLAVDEILRIREKRLRLLDDYRNEQEESILPLIREADDINKRKKKKSNGQFHAENNTSLRRSERIMTQTVNENRTLESPMHQPQLEPDPTSQGQHEPESEPEAVLMDESEPKPVPTDESEPEAVLMDESEPKPVPTDESEPEAILMDESEPEPVPTDESEPEAILMDESEPEPAPTDESEPEAILMDESEPEAVLMDESEPEAVLMDESEPEAVLMDESEPEAVPTDESEPDYLSMDESESELVSTDESEPELDWDEREQQAPRRHAVGQVPASRWRQPASSGDDNWYGEKEGFNIGHHWNTRLECSHDKVHRPSIAGIHPGPHGAYSVALSGAYPEDIDRGNIVIFTGAGGRDLRSSNGRSRNVRSAPQVRDQELNKANLSLIRSVKTGNPVRLIRGHKLGGSYAPERGYRYDGLYRVVRFWYGRGYSGFRVFRFKMCRLEDQTPPPWATARRGAPPPPPPPPPRDPTPSSSDSSPSSRDSSPSSWDSTPSSRDSSPSSRDTTPSSRDSSPSSRDSTPPPRDRAPRPSTSRGPSRWRAGVQNGGIPSMADIIRLERKIKKYVRRMCRASPSYPAVYQDRPPYGFRGWDIP